MDKKYAIIGPDNKALNFILWDGVSEFDYGQSYGNSLVPLDGVEDYSFGWEWDGSVFIPPPPPDPLMPIQVIPQVITPRQCRIELLNRGLLDQVEAMIAGQDQATRITWEYAVEFQRDNRLLISLAENLGLSNEQIDEFFVAAANL